MRVATVSVCSEQRSFLFSTLFRHKLSRALTIITVIALSGIFNQAAFGKETVRIATLDWPPYLGESMPREGYIAELIRESFKRSGYEVQFFYMPWDRAIKNVTEGVYDALTPTYLTEERQQIFHYSHEFPAGPFVFAKRKKDPIVYNTLDDLRPYKIAVVRGYVNTEEFDKADYLQKSFTNTDQTGYRRLLKGSVDLWMVDKFVGQYIMTQHLPEQAQEIEFLPKPLGVENFYVTFPKINENSKTLTNAFNKGLDEVLKDGTLQSILKQQGLSLD